MCLRACYLSCDDIFLRSDWEVDYKSGLTQERYPKDHSFFTEEKAAPEKAHKSIRRRREIIVDVYCCALIVFIGDGHSVNALDLEAHFPFLLFFSSFFLSFF